MKKMVVLVLVLVIGQGMFWANAESVVPGVPAIGTPSSEYQTIYLAGFCAANIVYGDICENIAAMRAICSQINVPTTETISCVFQEKDILLAVKISFHDLAFVEFFSEPVPYESVIPLLKKASIPAPAGMPRVEFSIDGRVYSLAPEDFISLFGGATCEKVLLRFPSPYDFPGSGALEDVEIVVLDASGQASAPEQYFYDENTHTLSVTDLDGLDSLPENLDAIMNQSNEKQENPS